MNFPKRFIKATEEFTTLETHIPAPYFRKVFSADTAVSGELLISACGFYELFFNGKRLTKGALAPYISNPDDLVYYDRYTVSLQKGKNVIGVLLGNGLCNNPGGHIWDFDKAPFRGAPKFALSLSYAGSGGAPVCIESGEDFKTAPSPIVFDDYRFGEHYDAVREIPGWNLPGFDDSAWAPALPADEPKGEKRLCEADPIVVTEERKPVAVTEINGKFVYDFGLNGTGVCRLTVKGAKGQKIEFQHVEDIVNGDIDVGSVWFVREHWERDKDIVHKDIYICKGEGTETYTPTFTYHGFRYVAVSGITKEQATDDLMTFLVMNSDVKKCGGFATSDATVQALQDMTVRSDLSNLHYFPTDCPQREKNGWTADAALSAQQMLLNLTVQNCFTEWLRNIRKAQTERGSLPGIVPTAGWGFDWGNGPAWDSVLTYLPYFTYVYRGETKMISESADAFLHYLQYLDSRKDENGLLAIGLGDWVPVGRECDDFKAPLIVTDSLISMDIARKIAVMTDAIGDSQKAAYAKKFADEIKAAFRKNLVDFSTMTVAGECESSQAMALYYGIFDESETDAAFAVLEQFIHEQNDRLDTGVLGGRVIFRVLSQFDRSDLALHMITAPGFPSYANWIERGATTLWEFFVTSDTGYSKNHHFWGDISAWFIECLAGIQYNPNTNNLKEVNICPAFVAALPDASAYFESNYGTISSAWKRTDQGITLTVFVPDGFTGKIILPGDFVFCDGTTEKTLQNGSFEIKEL